MRPALPAAAAAREDQIRKAVTVMSWLILAILAVLALLIIAGPVLEDLIDRIWPPGREHAVHHAPHVRGR